MSEIVVAATADLASLEFASRFVELCAGELAARGEWHVAVSGGSFATGTWPAMLEAGTAAGLDWSKLHVWFADERFLERGDPERNATPIAAALRSAEGFVPEHLHVTLASDGGEDLDAAAEAYAHELATIAPALDLVILGAGPDGHTASLFPGREAASYGLEGPLAIPVRESPKPPPERISLSLGAIRAADRVWAIVTGAGKADAVARAVDEHDPAASPLGAALAGSDRLLVLDEAAAAQLP